MAASVSPCCSRRPAFAWRWANGQKASFFLGAAVYVACVKWLGWAVFGRLAPARPRCLLFPAEVFAGLAVVCAWFYLRNLVAKVWPASYGLAELAWLFPALLRAALRLPLPCSWRRQSRQPVAGRARRASGAVRSFRRGAGGGAVVGQRRLWACRGPTR